MRRRHHKGAWLLPGALVALSGALLTGAAAQDADFESVLTRALTADREGRLDEAVTGYLEAARLRPGLPQVHYQLSWALFRKGMLPDALAAAERALALDPHEASFYLLEGSILRSLGNTARAESVFRKAAEGPFDAPEAYLALADLYQSSQQFEKAAEALRAYLERRPGDVEALYFLGTILTYQNEMDEALELLDRVTESKPDHARAWFRKAHVEAQKPDTMQDARASYERSLALDDHYAYGWYEYGTLLAKLGEEERALAAFRRALELEPELSQADYAMGTLLSRLGRHEEAKTHLERFKAERDREAQRKEAHRRALAAFGRGRELLQADRVEEAIEAFLEVTELDPRSHQAYSFLAKSYASLGQTAVALGYIRRAMELSPGTSEYPYLLALFLKDRGDLPGAVAALQKAIALDPEDGLLHNAIGVLLDDAGDHEAAVRVFETARKLDPDNPAISLNLAAAYRDLGEAEKSDAAMKRYREQIATARPPQ